MTTTDCRMHRLVGDVTLRAADRVLLVQYRGLPGRQRGWSLPHDRLNHLEHPDDAARRVLAEQLGLVASQPRLSHIESNGRDSCWRLAFRHVAELASVPAIIVSEAVRGRQWFALHELPERAAMAHGGWALDTLRRVLGAVPSGVAIFAAG